MTVGSGGDCGKLKCTSSTHEGAAAAHDSVLVPCWNASSVWQPDLAMFSKEAGFLV